MRVFFISFVIVGFLILALMGVRQWGLMTPYQRFEHGFLDPHPKPHLMVQVSSLEEAREVLGLGQNLILWLELRMSADGQILVLNRGDDEKALSAETLGDRWKGHVLSRYNLQELRVVYPEANLLEEFLKEFVDARMVLFLKDNAADVHHYLIKAVENFSPEKRFLFHSDIEIVQKSLKEKMPLWLYGSSVSDVMKILTFESIGLESASPLQADVFISNLALKGRPAFNEGVLNEVRRRQKDIFLGPLRTKEELEAARAFAPEGFLFPSVEVFEEIWAE